MQKQLLPTYNICSLSEVPMAHKDFIADRFDHYLEAHKDLRFPHKHDFYHLVYFTAGSGTHAIDFIQFEVKPGQIYFMAPGQVHTWNFDKAPNGFIVNFSAGYLHDFVANTRYLEQFNFFLGIANEQVIDVPKSVQPTVKSLLQKIVDEANSATAWKDDMAKTALVQLLITVERLNTKDNENKVENYNSVVLRNFQKLIETHYKEMRLTKDYAALLYVTPNHLNALAKDITGKPAGELIRERVLLEAKRLLINAEMTIAQIAATLEFDDNSYFSKFFKKYAGATPEVFRKTIHHS